MISIGNLDEDKANIEMQFFAVGYQRILLEDPPFGAVEVKRCKFN